MKQLLRYSSLLLVCGLLFLPELHAQSESIITGTITDADTKDPLVGVNISIKGRVAGTVSDFDGKFRLRVSDTPPFTLIFSIVGFETQEITFTRERLAEIATRGIQVALKEQVLLGQEVVVSASRMEERLLESPVTIEKMDILAVQNTPADNYYKGLAFLKGVDVATSSINFQIINTRGFASTGNTRFVQLTDGMDTQAPALNFPIGNLNGPSELDVESVELIPGASSALYGPNAFNGILLVNSKNAFEYQGLSAFYKQGVNHVGPRADQQAAPMFEGALRYAKAFNDKFAFKINVAYMKADDWHGTSPIDREVARTPEDFPFNPGADRLNFMGDEASINLAIFPLSDGWRVLARNAGFSGGRNAEDFAIAGDLPAHIVSVSPIAERYLVDYGAENLKFNTGLYYRLNDRIEASYLLNYGYGTSVYTGAQRYSLKNFAITQHRFQLKGDNFFVRAYTTRENSGDSYIAEFLAKRIYDQASGGNVSTWLGTYGVNYLRYLSEEAGLAPGQINTLPDQQRLQTQIAAHEYARSLTEQRFPVVPGTPEFEVLKEEAMRGVVPFGPRFNDRSNLYHVEGQYDFKDDFDFMELQVGASGRIFELVSNGTIFDDADGPILIREWGAYAQAGKRINDKFKLSGSLRYDKNENFKGQFNPRISGVYKLKENHVLRLSYQTGFRIPTTQGQHIDLNILTARLLGGLPRYAEKYDITGLSSTGVPLGFEGFSVQEYSTAVFNQGATSAAIFNPANIALLQPFTEFNPVKPEQVRNVEVGYKGVINNKLLIDAVYYYNAYTDFITQVRVRRAAEFTAANAPRPELIGTPNYATILNGTDLNTFQIYTNISEGVTSQGAAVSLSYVLPRNWQINSNYNWNVINNVPDGFLAEFNTPEHKVNFGLSNRKITKNWGGSVNWRWQSAFRWESSFVIPAAGIVPAYNTLDAQMSYRWKDLKSVVKFGGSNLINRPFVQSLGGVNIGAIYYVSITFDELFN